MKTEDHRLTHLFSNNSLALPLSSEKCPLMTALNSINLLDMYIPGIYLMNALSLINVNDPHHAQTYSMKFRDDDAQCRW